MDIEIKAALDELNKIAVEKVDTLDKDVKTKLEDLTDKFNTQQKHLDQLDIRNKNSGGQSNHDVSLPGEIRKAFLHHTGDFEKLSRNEIKSFGMEVKTVGDMTLAGNYTGGTVATSSAVIGIMNVPKRLLHIRDLLRKGTMTGSQLPILKDNGGEGAVAPVVAGDIKPQIDFDLSEVSAKAETIAGIVQFHKDFLADIPQAQSWLIEKMTYAYYLAEDNQLLNGDGVSPNLSGINDNGNYVDATYGGSYPDVIQLVRGILQLRSLGRNPTGIIIHPDDYGDILLNQAGGSLEFDLPSFVSVSSIGLVNILGVPVIDTVAQIAGRYNIIDNDGSLMAIRQNITIEFFAQGGENVIRNKITGRIESRIAYPTYAATYAIAGYFDTGS